MPFEWFGQRGLAVREERRRHQFGPIKIMLIGTLQSAAFGFPQSFNGVRTRS